MPRDEPRGGAGSGSSVLATGIQWGLAEVGWLSDMMVVTSAKSRLINPGIKIRSEMP